MIDISPALGAAMARFIGKAADVRAFTRLTGGANMESSSFDYAGRGYVLRRAPSAEMMAERPFGHDVEAAIIRAAASSGVKAPIIVGELTADDGIGTGYVMERVEADVNPAKILAAPPASLITDIARELARIHAMSVSDLPRKSSPERGGGPSRRDGGGAPAQNLAPPAPSTASGPPPRSVEDFPVPTMNTATALADLKARFVGYGGDRPILALALRWLEDNLPAPVPPVLVHGDFRMGNLMVDGQGLAAVLDWEIAHLGDAHEDLAYGCMTVWRFGQIEKPAFGVSDLETYFAAYTAESGTTVDRSRFRFWLVYRTFWWALGCMQMADIWRNGADRTLERVVIGRRTSENELDLLMLLEDDAPETQRLPLTLDAAPEPRRLGEPSTAEMLEAITEWILADVKPNAEGHDRFKVAVALNALGMLTREATNPVAVHDKALADDILAGRKTLATPGLLTKLRKAALAKLGNDVPKYAALAKARGMWGAG